MQIYKSHILKRRLRKEKCFRCIKYYYFHYCYCELEQSLLEFHYLLGEVC
jgi:hypothetical protein